ncbi:hypothetical protein C8J56DRAFT_1000085 [Mycena floridula]|nr:hypothetical protein C8J56DRAFT_1000085 [Mycena floridula]
MALTPPQAAPAWTHSASEILKTTEDLIESNRKVQDKIAALAPSDCNYESLALAEADTHFDAVSEPLAFYQNVSPSKELRDASTDAESLVRDFGVESSMRLDVFQVKTNAEKNIKASGQWEKLSAEEQRLVDKMILDGKRAGLALPEKARDELTKLKKELSQICLEFSKNFNEENGVVSFTAEELDGVPKDVISGYTKRTEDGKTLYDVTFKTPDIFPLEINTDISSSSNSRNNPEPNVPLLSKALDLRRQIAKLLEYETWADYVTEPRMIKNAAGVSTFLDELEKKLLLVGIKDRDTLLTMKKKEHEELGIPFDGQFYIWDYRYYGRKYVEDSLDLDDSLVKEYFPVSIVVPAILEIYQALMGVQFEEIKGEIWHPDVQQFSVWEKDSKDESDFIGYCYLDLFPREAKYPHAAMWPLLAAIAAIVANLAKATGDKPALMTHRQVVTFYHEMGHVFHSLLSKTKFARFHGTNVVRDFVEAPSQMLENWCWEPKVLAKISSHYQSKEALPAAMTDKLLKSRYVNVGLFYLYEMFHAKFDLKVEADYTELWTKMRESISLVKSLKKDPGQGNGGYDAGYYGLSTCYLYSLVFAADMYATVFKADPLDPARGKLYRDKILKYGSSREEIDSLKDFLGRAPDTDAFIKEIFGDNYVPSNL